MIVAFDLDDTLYPERTFVESGFRAVARSLRERWGVDAGEALDVMLRSLDEHGRGTQFDDVVKHFGLTGRQSVRGLVETYRRHNPEIALPPESRGTIEALRPRPIYIVTDGHKHVQQRKVHALGLTPIVRKAYITHRYGIHHRKPSTRVFELMARRERAELRDIVYVGDDASKDFRGIKPLGARTIRVRTGRHAEIAVPVAEDAEVSVASIAEVPAVVADFERGTYDPRRSR